MENMYKMFIRSITTKEAKKLSEITSFSPIEILQCSNNIKPLLSFCEYEDYEKNNFSINQINNFDIFFDLIKKIENSGINFYFEEFSNLREVKKDYEFNKNIENEVNILSELQEFFPTSESWESEENGKKVFYVEIDGNTYNSEYALQHLVE